MTRVLVTGATGFIGRQSLSALLQRGYEVHAVSRNGRGPLRDRIEWHKADLLDQSQRERVVHGAGAARLLHFAWYVEHQKYWSSRENLRWAAATLDLAHSFGSAGGERIVVAGTCAEYKWSQGLLSEDSPLRPRSPYAVAKHAVREVLQTVKPAPEVQVAWGRIFFVYGPHEDQRRLVPYVITSLLEGREAICSSGEQIRDFSHVQDVGRRFAALLDSDVVGAVNMASGTGTAVAQVVLTIGRLMDRQELVRLGGRAATGEVPEIVGDVRRLTDEVGLSNGTSVEAGLADTIEWWRSRR
jgi:nucleoside-diphosphate-sugar epimerase